MLYGRLRSRVYPDSPWWRVELEADRVSSYCGQAALSVHEAVYPRVKAEILARWETCAT